MDGTVLKTMREKKSKKKQVNGLTNIFQKSIKMFEIEEFVV